MFLGRGHPILNERHCVKPLGTAVFTKLAWSPAPLGLRVEDSVCRQVAETLREKGNRRRRRGEAINWTGQKRKRMEEGQHKGIFSKEKRRGQDSIFSRTKFGRNEKGEKRWEKKDTRWRRVIVYCGSIVLFPQSSLSHLTRSSLYSSTER